MNLIAIIAALVCERLLSHLRRWRSYDWFGRYLARLAQPGMLNKAWHSAWGLLFLAPPLLLVGVIQWRLVDGILGVLGFVFAIVVLIFALGPRDLWEEVHELIAARKAGRHDEASAIVGHLTAVAGRGSNDDPDHRELVQAVLLQAHERVLGVLFWFFVLGPLGAAGYRLIAALPGQLVRLQAGSAFVAAAARLHAIAAWLPLRLSAGLYGLAGHADGALAGWRRAESSGHDWVVRGWHLLAETGHGALRLENDPVAMDRDETLRDALGLAWRSLLILLAVLAALTIGGWLA